jgi:hypothetical protein
MSLDDIIKPEYREEANRILKMPLDLRSAEEFDFVESLIQNPDKPVTRKMIFWLRDIKDRTQ